MFVRLNRFLRDALVVEFGCLQWKEQRERFSEENDDHQQLIDCQNGDELCEAPASKLPDQVKCCPIADSSDRDCFAQGGSSYASNGNSGALAAPACASGCYNRFTRFHDVPLKDENGCFEWAPIIGGFSDNERRQLPMFQCQRVQDDDSEQEVCKAPDVEDDTTFCCQISRTAPSFDDVFHVGGSFQSDDGVEGAESCATTEVGYGDVSEMYVETNADGCLEWKFGE